MTASSVSKMDASLLSVAVETVSSVADTCPFGLTVTENPAIDVRKETSWVFATSQIKCDTEDTRKDRSDLPPIGRFDHG